MPMTDDEIRTIRYFGLAQPAQVRELCTRVLAAETEAETLDTVASERLIEIFALQARVKALEDALREILDEIGDQNYHELYALARAALEGK